MLEELKRLPLVLASQSPRRRGLLAITGWLFNVRVADIDETQHSGETPVEYVQRMAREKVAAIAARQHNSLVIIAADTIVVDGDMILGKPANLREAEAILMQLRGRTHMVYTAIAVHHIDKDITLTDLCATEVQMRHYSPDELRRYIITGDPLDKAGGYAIQHPNFHPATVTGCYANVMGLPLCHLTRTLAKLGITSHEDVPAACQVFTQYTCPVYQDILAGEL